MKYLILCLLLTGCSTTVYGPTGKPLLRTFGDARNLAFTAPGTTFSADELNHSTPTTAGGRVLNNAIGGAGAIIAAGAGGSVIR